MTPQCSLPKGFQAGAAIKVDPNLESIAVGLSRLFEMSASERQEMGRRGLELVKRQFTWPKVARQVLELSEWVVEGGKVPGFVVFD